jgi:LPXTG-motif cell wall-anchored protein
MNTIPLQWIIVAGVVVVALLAVAAWLFSRKKKQSERLQQRFGPEYGRTVGELGGRTKAESELKAREDRAASSITQRGSSSRQTSWFVS